MRLYLICFLCVLYATATAAPPTDSLLTVSGKGEVCVPPDSATLGIGIESRSTDLQQAKTNNNQRLQELLRVLKETGVAADDVTAGSYSVRKQFKADAGTTRAEQEVKDLINKAFAEQSGSVAPTPEAAPEAGTYIVERSISVKVGDLSKVEPLMETLCIMNIAGINLSFQSAKAQETRDQVRLLAFREAKRKAEAMAKEAGVKIRGIQSIAEDRDYGSAEGWLPAVHQVGTGPKQELRISGGVQVSFIIEN